MRKIRATKKVNFSTQSETHGSARQALEFSATSYSPQEMKNGMIYQRTQIGV